MDSAGTSLRRAAFGGPGFVLLPPPLRTPIVRIHILAFDHLIGVLIHRDNMRHRFVLLPLQPIFPSFTLLLGPVGVVTCRLVRRIRKARREGHGEAGHTADPGLDLDSGGGHATERTREPSPA